MLTEQPNAAWARFYMGQGWKVIPIHVKINGACSCGKNPCGDTGVVGEPGYNPVGKNAGKHPVQQGWQTETAWVRSEADVRRWWGDTQGIPYSLGLVCGAVSGVWVLDVDPRNGGFESLDRLEAEHGVLPATRRGATGGGGKHFLLKMPSLEKGQKLKKGPLHKDYPGLDVQSDGAQVVLAPSFHASGRRYEWESTPDAVVAETPEWLRKLIDGDRGHPGAGLGGAGVDITKLMQVGVPEGERNNTVYKVACRFARKLGVASDLDKQLVFSSIESFNRDFVRPPIELDELAKLTKSAVDFIEANPGSEALPPGVEAWLESQRGGTGGASVPPDVPQDAGGRPAVAPPTAPALLSGGSGGSGGGSGTQVVLPSTSAGAGASNGSGAGSPAGGGGGGPVGPTPAANAFGPGGLPPDPDSLGPDGTPGFRTLTDNGNARRIVDYFEHEVRYSEGLGWYRWDDITWTPDAEELFVTALSRELPVRIVSEIANYPGGAAPQADLFKHASNSRTSASIRKAVALANTDPRIQVRPAVWDSDANFLGVKNGVVDLRTGKLIPIARDQYITKRTACGYDPRARDTRFEIWLDQVTGGDKELQRWLQRWAGYCLTGETREEKFIMLYGPAGTGKSTFLELVKAAAGDYGITLQAENITAQKFGKTNEEYYNAQLVGKRVIVISELLEGERMKEDSIKRLTGADSMVGRHPGGKPIQFTSHAKLMIGTNNRPRVVDNAMWRRVKLVPFTHVPQVLDPSLKPYLLDPDGGLPAFLAWAVEGAVAWYMNGLGACAVVDEATDEYKQAEDEIGIFLTEELRAGEGLSVAMSDVHAVYKVWAEDRGLQSPGHINKLMRSLGDRGLDVEGTGRRARLLGWALMPRAVPNHGTQNWSELVRGHETI